MSSSDRDQSLPSISLSLQGSNRASPGERSSLQRSSKDPSRRVPRGQRNPRSFQPGQRTTPDVSGRDPPISSWAGPRSSERGLPEPNDDRSSSRNWNSEGGRPKRERSLIRRTSGTGRLLRRSSINSVGELIPFQRAPRDGSYESRLPVSRKATSQRSVGGSRDRDASNGSQRPSGRLQNNQQVTGDMRSSSLTDKKGTSMAPGPQIAPRANQPLTNGRRASGTRPDQGSQTSSRVQLDAKLTMESGGPRRTTGALRTPSSGINAEPKGSSPARIPGRETTSGGDAETSSVSSSGTDDTNSLTLGMNSPLPFDGFLDEDDDEEDYEEESARIISSPSAAFKAAAAQHRNVDVDQPSPSRSTLASVSPRHMTLGSAEETNTPSGNQGIEESSEHRCSSPQPNSVARQRLNPGDTPDTHRQPGPASASPRPLTQLRQRPRAGRDSEASSSRGLTTARSRTRTEGSGASSSIISPIPAPPSVSCEAVSLSARPSATYPPRAANSSGSLTDASHSSSTLSRVNRFGRRVRVPPSDRPDDENVPQLSSRQVRPDPEPVSSSGSGSFALDANLLETMTPSRDRLYGTSSPPLLRRHHRRHFGTGTSIARDSLEDRARLRDSSSQNPSISAGRTGDPLDGTQSEASSSGSSSIRPPSRAASLEVHIPLLGTPVFAGMPISPEVFLGLLMGTQQMGRAEFMELLLENMILNILAHHLEGDQDGMGGAPPPASEAAIHKLKTIPAREKHIEKELKCAICHCEYELNESLAELPCEHFFHPNCVAIWLKKSGTCPVCRFQLQSVG